ncbi:MAG: hypothetical protein M0021_16305 [Clostridia bacterium]|nr:hypothetical protein [Clostridia bacterium]
MSSPPAFIWLFILGGIAIAAAATGIGKGIHAVVQNNEAKDVNRRTSNIYDTAKDNLENARKKSEFALEGLGEVKLNVLDKSVNRCIDVFSKIHNVELDESVGLDELRKFKMDKQSLEEMRKLGGFASSLLGGAVGGSLAGGLAAFGAYSAAMTFGAASTGTAIASLSGVAATNATLAFLGGGSLAAGGLGIAGGTMVLGGVVAGPALAVLGFVLDAKASKNLDNAYSNIAEARKIAEEFGAATDICNGITERSEMFFDLILRLDELFRPLIDKIEMIIDISGCDYSQYNLNSKKVVAMAMSVAAAIKKVLDTPILTKDGMITDISLNTANEILGFLTAAQNT